MAARCIATVTLALVFGLIASAPAQTFDVVSIKPADPNLRTFGAIRDPGRIAFPRVNLRGLILSAYGLEGWQLSGGDDWVSKQFFAVQAQTAAPADPTQMRSMMRQLLADRFALRLAPTPRTGNVYRLEPVAGGAKLNHKPSGEIPGLAPRPALRRVDGTIAPVVRSAYRRVVTEADGKSSATVDMAFFGEQATLSDLAAALSETLQAPVTDATGLAGKFDFTIRYADRVGASFDPLPTLPDALKQQLGLQLVRGSGSFTVYTIVSARKPDAN